MNIRLDYLKERTIGEKNTMVAKVSTIKNKIKKGKKLGVRERARAVNKVLLPSKRKKNEKSKSKNKKSY